MNRRLIHCAVFYALVLSLAVLLIAQPRFVGADSQKQPGAPSKTWQTIL